MKKLVLGAALAGLVGCVSAPFRPPVGLVSTIKAPLSNEGNWKMGAKCGESVSTCILGLAAYGDCSISAAAANAPGGMTMVHHVDYEYNNILGIWQQTKVIVYGE